MSVSASASGDPFTSLPDFPYPARELHLSGARLRYVDEGSGPPLLVLHGNPTWSYFYRRLIEHFRRTHRVVAPDHVGCGRSDKPARYPYTLRQHIDNAERLVEKLDLHEITLVVHDWGGAIGFGLAMRQPRRFQRFVVLNTAAFPGAVPWRIRLCRPPVVGEILVRGLNGFARAALRMAVARRERLTQETRAGYLAPYDCYAHRAALLAFVRDIPMHESQASHAALVEIEASLAQWRGHPMLICWGAKDFCFHDGFFAEWRRRFPQAQAHRFADAGHYVLEDAHERVLPLMDAFLNG